MTNKNNLQFDNITIKYSPKLVQITCDDILKSYLKEKGNGAVKLAAFILEKYTESQGTPLKISLDSLAIEILGHTYVDSFSAAISDLNHHLPSVLRRPLEKLIDQIRHHTGLIDCGEADIDNNRWIWDKLSIYKTFIYKIMGDLA